MRSDKKNPFYIILTNVAKKELAEKGEFYKHDVIVAGWVC